MIPPFRRRTFLRQSALAGAALLAPWPRAARAQPKVQDTRPQLAGGDWRAPSRALRGVNLGAWLVLEKWMTPSLFRGVEAHDEWSFSQMPNAREKLENHRKTFITERDFEWLKVHGLDAVRLPIGYWTLEENAPSQKCKIRVRSWLAAIGARHRARYAASTWARGWSWKSG